MASNATQILVDGPRNVVTKTTGDDSAAGIVLPPFTVIQDPATLSSMLPGVAGPWQATKLRIDSIQYSISDGIALQFYWQATTPLLIAELTGRGRMEFVEFGGLQNNAGAGVNGQITFSVITVDAVATGNVTWTFTMETVKFRPQSVGGA